MRLVSLNAGTEYGRRFGFSSIKTIEDYQKQVPIITYEDIKSDMERVVTGEKVSVNQVITAFQKASQDTGVVPDHFKAETDVKNSRYLFRVEFTKSVNHDTQKAFLKGLDNYLIKVNIEYKAKRDSLRLGNPILHVM